MGIKTFTPAIPELRKVASELYSKAIAHEKSIALDWRTQLSNNNDKGQYTHLLSIQDDWIFLRKILETFGDDYTNTVSLRRSKPLDQNKFNVPYKVYGKYTILRSDGTYIAGSDIKKAAKPISDNRITQIHEIADYIGEWAQDRLIPVVWEEVGQEVLQDFVHEQYKNIDVVVEESTDRKYDFVMKFPYPIEVFEDRNGLKYTKEFRMPTDWRFDYKTDLDNFHVADKHLSLSGADITSNLYDYVCSTILRQKIEKYYPTFISLHNKGEILFSSEMLSDPSHLYLTEPPLLSQEHIERMATEIFEKHQKSLISTADAREGLTNLANEGLSDVVMKHLYQRTLRGSLWYSRTGQYKTSK